MPPVGPAPGVPTPPPASAVPPSAVDPNGIPPAVAKLLEQRCLTCHQYGIRDPAGWGSALDLSRMIEADIVVPGSLEGSRLWYRVAVRNDMPLNGSRLTPDEKGLLQQWILEMKRPVERIISNEQILDILVQDQRRGGAVNNDFRYLSFRHMADAGRSAAEIKAMEGLTNYLLNSLSRRQAIIRVEPVDDQRSIFRFRISQLGWAAADWNDIVSFYPYCLQSNVAAHQDLYQKLETEAPFVRGDWFAVNATQSPLYERLANLGANLDELEASLNIDIDKNVADGNVKRIGQALSGVSKNHRIIERHELPQRAGDYFWWSYDFANRQETSDIHKNPLGPARAVGDRFQSIFVEAGGEAIWSLPNRMQGYFLTDNIGTFLSEAPTFIVTDPRNGRNEAVRNAIACSICHGMNGMIFAKNYTEIVDFVEEHREDFDAAEIAEVRKIYPRNGQGLLQADSNLYLRTLSAIGPTVTSLLSGGGVTEWDYWTTLIGQYEANVGLRGGAVELGIPPDVARTLFRLDTTVNEDTLPIRVTDPLIARNEWLCKFRLIVGTDVRRGVNFCDGTFVNGVIEQFPVNLVVPAQQFCDIQLGPVSN
jgi:hypothetical protein